MKQRLDTELVQQGFFATKKEAYAAVLAGEVSSEHERLTHPGKQVPAGIYLHVKSHIPFVSRGGFKLVRALEAFGIDVRGKKCLDVGASTGGFTDCLLQNGAACVTAVDVGYAQFSWELRNNPKVELIEKTNICAPSLQTPDHLFDVVVSDVSFTSIQTIIAAVNTLMKPRSLFVTLVKPQFEVDKTEVGSGGIVRSKRLHIKAIERALRACASVGLVPLALCPSPIYGHKGNREFLLAAGKDARQSSLSSGVSLIDASSSLDVSSVVDSAEVSARLYPLSAWLE